MTDKDKHLTDLFIEIINYADENKQYSYYELEAYAISNRLEWEDAFKDKNIRAALSAYLKSARKETKTKVKPMHESYQILLEAKQNKNGI